MLIKQELLGGGASYIGMIGCWDPLRKSTLQLLTRMSKTADDQGMRGLAIVLDPPPAELSQAAGACLPRMLDLKSRLAALGAIKGLDYLVIDFIESDLDSDCRAILGLVTQRVHLAELWLGAGQSLGRGSSGSVPYIREVCTILRISLNELTGFKTAVVSRNISLALRDGRIKDVVRHARIPLILHRPAGGTIPLNWREGAYEANLCLDDLKDQANVGSFAVEVRSMAGANCLLWPSPLYRRVRIVSGPGDYEADPS